LAFRLNAYRSEQVVISGRLRHAPAFSQHLVHHLSFLVRGADGNVGAELPRVGPDLWTSFGKQIVNWRLFGRPVEIVAVMANAKLRSALGDDQFANQ
jgi:hypothetical protein